MVHLENQTWAMGEDEEDEGNDKDEDELPELLGTLVSLRRKSLRFGIFFLKTTLSDIFYLSFRQFFYFSPTSSAKALRF